MIRPYNLALQFEAVAQVNADLVALLFAQDDFVTYAQLNAEANRRAHFLLNQNVRKGRPICISGHKTPHCFANILACLKIGAPYAVLDPDSPAKRLSRIMERCAPELVLGGGDDRAITGAAAQGDFPYLEDAAVAAGAAGFPGELPGSARKITGANPAYIMFTSGSTGFPKGAVVSHANVQNLISWSLSHYGFGPGERLTNVNPLYFDNSVFDFYSALFSGAALVPFTRTEILSPVALVTKVDALECTSWFSVPSMLMYLQTMRAFSSATFRAVKRFIFGGEGYPKTKLKDLYAIYSSQAEFHNVYGPTECTCICSSYRIGDKDLEDLAGFPPLGLLIENFDFLLLSPQGNSCRPGEKGELCLLGPNVGLGYYNDQERTAEAFMPNPQTQGYAEAMYKTGDLVSLSPEDGMLRIHGRADNQIKHMGYRIELEEIENALNCVPGVARAAVVYLRDGDAPGNIMAAVEAPGAGTGSIEKALTEKVPSYMLPSRIELMPRLPRNQNGKIDRLAVADHFRNLSGTGRACS